MSSTTISSETLAVPKVSVSVITYNHRHCVARAIDSVLQQQVDFPYEIIIGDDCSSDGTQALLREYQQQHPEVIQLILHPRRYAGVAGRLNNITNLYACRGQYIAMLDGDDYWISPDKLRTQVNFLERHPDYVMTFHDARFVSDDPSFTPYYQSETHDILTSGATYTYRDIVEGWFIQTSTLLFRNRLIGEFPEWFWHIYSADYALQLLVAQYGKIKYLEQIKGARRLSNQSFTFVYNTSLAHNRLRIEEFKIFRQHLPNFWVGNRLGKFYYRRALLYLKKRGYFRAAACLIRAVVLDQSIARMLARRAHNRVLNVIKK
jgi:glycosyltransferase involved in cell wall biosynthesis